MSDISSINSSLLTNLLNSQQSDLIQAASSQAQDTGSAGITDIVSLLGGSTPSNDSLYGLLSGTQGSDSTDSTYNLLLAGANAELLKSNPTLIQAILSADQSQAQTTDAEASSGSSQSQATSTQALQDLQNINLLTISPETLASLLERYLQSKNAAAAQTTSGSQVNQSV